VSSLVSYAVEQDLLEEFIIIQVGKKSPDLIGPQYSFHGYKNLTFDHTLKKSTAPSFTLFFSKIHCNITFLSMHMYPK
jgi:hypothetical protein